MLRTRWAFGSQSGRVVAVVLVAGLVAVLAVGFVSQRYAVGQADRPPGPMMPRPFAPVGPPGGGQGLQMLWHQPHMYIAQGGTLYKIDVDDMRVMKELQFAKPPPRPMGPPEPPRPPREGE